MKTVFIGLGIAIFCANLGFLACYTFLPLYAIKFGASMSEIGILLAAYSMVSTVMMFTLGRFSDIKGLRTKFIILGLAGSATIYWLLGVSSTYLHLLLLWGFLGVTDSAYRPTVFALIAEIVPKARVGRYIGIFNAFMSAGMATGCLVGGIIADLFSLSFVFTISSIVLVLAVGFSLVALKINRDSKFSLEVIKRRQSVGPFRGQYLVSSGLLLLCLDVFLRNSGFRGVTTFLPIYLESLGAENSLTGTIIAINFASQVAFMPMMGWLSDKIGRKHVLSIGMFTTLIVTFMLSVIYSPLDVIPIELGVAFSWAAITVASNAFAADVAPAEKLGEAMGLVFTSMNLGGVVGPIVAGAVSDRVDLRTTFQILSLFPMLGFVFSLKISKSPIKPTE